MIKVDGLNELTNKLHNLQTELKRFENGIDIPFDELFNYSFMCKYTNSSNINDFLISGGFSVKTTADFKAIPDEELDSYVRTCTSFDSWSDMLDEASKLYIANKLDL